MQKRVFLHVGLPKSGTTFVQAVLGKNKQQLMTHAGLLYPGATWSSQVAAVRDVRAMPVPRSEPGKVHGAWARLVEEIDAWPGNAVLSMEWLCRATAEQIQRIVADLEPATVEVVFTVRDLGRTLPAAWQESIQNQHEWSWQEFLDGITADEPLLTKPGRRFWALHDAARLLDTWAQVVPPEQIHLVTIPRPGVEAAVLWERLCKVLDIDGSGYAVDGLTGNASLGIESVEFLRRLNPLSRERGISRSVHKRVFTQGMAKRGLARREHSYPRLALPDGTHEWTRNRAAEEVRAIEGARVHLVGDLDELSPELREGQSVQPADLGADALLEVALAALVTVVEQGETELQEVSRNSARELEERNQELSRLSRQHTRLKRRHARMRTQLEQLQARPARTALAAYTRRYPRLHAAAEIARRLTERRRHSDD
ncbi:MAG: hypothetical protein M3393_06695 [Actinomycetota bacterium]|nr:hypothetical protein [Actinomycetota bacterium]